MQKKKKLTIRLDPDVSKNLQLYCIQNDTSAQELIENYIKQLLENKEQ